jgi:hypothetical protein
MTEEIPQIIAIVSVSTDGKINLKKDVRQHLGMKDDQNLFLNMQNEMTLSAHEKNGEQIAVMKGNRIRLPEKALSKLDITERALVGLVQRKNAVAVKKFEVVEEEGERARVVDLETAHKITRKIETNPMPERILPKLKEQYKDFQHRYDVKGFLKGRRTFEAWKARKILGIAESSDEELRGELVRERLEKQMENGSWEGLVTVTARNLRELADLGMAKDDERAGRAVDWLFDRPQSAYNSGMFFLRDELVKEQEEVIKSRQRQKRGTRERFRQLKTSEKNLVKAGDDLIINPCGPRIMWPTALVLEALLKLGYEENDRVQEALRTLMFRDWCECGYQHGLSESRRKEPFSMEEIEKIEESCIQQYRNGGAGELEKEDLTHRGHMLRIADNSLGDVDEYPLRMQTHIQGCEVATTRAMSQVKNKKMRRFAEAHLWRFAGRQHSSDGRFAVEKYGTGHSQVGFLSIFARYDHPVSRLVIMRSIPWIINDQNEDGSWGEEPNKDGSTLAVISALKSVELL